MDWTNLEDRSERLLGRILLRHAEKTPDHTYIMAGEDRYSYGRVNELSNAYAAGLRGLGITFITVGLLAIAFMLFSGIQL